MKRKIFYTSTTAVLMMAGSAALAQTDEIVIPESDDLLPESGEIVSVGTALGLNRITDLSSPVSVLTKTEIEARNQTYIGELLRSQPGIAVNRSGPGGALTQIRMRGSEASHVLVLVDGIEVANPAAGEFDLSGIRSADIMKIEVLRGEQSALYGPDAVGGVINIITRASSVEPVWEASIETGSFGTLDGQASAVIPVGKASLSLSAGALHTDGYDISGQSGEKDGSQSRHVNIGLNRLELGGVSLSAKVSDSHLKTEFDEDLFFSGRLDDTQSVTLVDSFGARANADFVLMGFDHRISVSRHKTKTDSRASFPSISEGRRDKAQWTARKDWNRHALTVLAETETETYAITPNFAFAPDEPKNTAQAIAADYRYSWDKLNLSGSIRRDFNDRFDDAVTWKIGASYSIPTIGGQLRASAGPGVKNPSMIELFGFYPEANFVGNASLTPEKSFGFGLGYTQELLDGDLKLSADYFRSEFKDEIFTDFSSSPFLARNRSFDSKREGLELTMDWTVSDTVDIYGSASVLETTENGNRGVSPTGIHRQPDDKLAAGGQDCA